MANTIADKLTYLSDTKNAIRQAIIAKNVDVTDTDTFRSYADKITSIQTGGGGGTGSLVTGTKLAYSTFSTIPDEYIPYLEQQTDLSYMFGYCNELQTVSSFSTSSVSVMGGMFSSCKSLHTVQLLDARYVLYLPNIFAYCNSLTNLGGLTGLKVNLDLHYSPLVTTESVMNIINYAKNMTSSPKTLTLHQDAFNKLSEEQITTASAKGWNIAAK